MSSWSRSSYRSAAAEPAAAAADTDGWQTVGAPRSTRTWGSDQPTTSRWGQQTRTWSSSGGGGPEMPSAFSKKPRGDDRPPRRQTDEEARRDYMMKLAAEKAVKEAEQAKQIADTEDNFPTLGGPKRSLAAPLAPPPPKKTWATQIKKANDENEQKRLAEEKAAEEEANKLAEGMTVLRINRKDMREPFFTTGAIEREGDFARNEVLRRACFSSSIMAEQEKYDYNNEAAYGHDDLDSDEPRRAYSPHSPPYSPTYREEDQDE